MEQKEWTCLIRKVMKISRRKTKNIRCQRKIRMKRGKKRNRRRMKNIKSKRKKKNSKRNMKKKRSTTLIKKINKKKLKILNPNILFM